MLCQVTYGIRTGEMPRGTMRWYKDERLDLEGFDKSTCPFVIVIEYQFPNGVLPDGTHYTGTGRRSYLPGNAEGIECLGLLVLAFKRKLSFLVGTSLTTG